VTDDERFSLASAQEAAKEGRLAEWVVDFLASPGSSNSTLAAAFAIRGATYLGPIQFALDRLTPMAGPAGHDVVVPVAERAWESDVEAMEYSMEHGWHPPPLLVSHHDGKYFLEDGNHRYETLRRMGATHAWIVLLFAGEAERDRYLEEHGGGPTSASDMPLTQRRIAQRLEDVK
jgi:hypothetical protein